MALTLAVRPYRRRFVTPLHTAHGRWVWRQGLLLRLQDAQGRVGYGEVAPIPWFGSETLAAALAFLTAQGGAWGMAPVPDHLPATQFGLAGALADLAGAEDGGERERPAIADLCGLLPAGSAALAMAAQRWAEGHRTRKGKIGVLPLEQEIGWLEQLVAELPEGLRLRLDANGGLDLAQAERWLRVCDRINSLAPGRIEHLEQPLPADALEPMIKLSQRYQTPLALDESVATVGQLEHCWAQGWRGVLVVKPAIAGAPQRLEAFCQAHRPRLVFSSVFETPVGRGLALALAARCGPDPAPALGFGTQGSFADHWDTLTPAALWQML
ncbi:MAG TPA: o-succinylbenzoate synthase [Nodosilinea sp.]|nr:o-succinylbenzoate synthase [Nodosilinea sp.]